jgi:hypothetical protein
MAIGQRGESIGTGSAGPETLNPHLTMATTYGIHPGTETAPTVHEHHVIQSTQTTLRVAYGLVPVVAGFDKFTNFLTQWEQYLNPAALNIIPVTASAFMRGVGIIEVVAGILTLVRPKIGSPIVAAWLLAIALQLLANGTYLDVAVRDVMLALGALTLWRLSRLTDAWRTPA